MTTTPSWIELSTGKEFSRLLYTNPVCFLCTQREEEVETTIETEAEEDVAAVTTTMNTTNTNTNTTDNTMMEQEEDVVGVAEATSNSSKSISSRITANTKIPLHNVMVLSWLTATNNNGRFMFSINRKRQSASNLLRAMSKSLTNQEAWFTLSVPVRGMEDLVRNVGSVSARWGCSKFPADHEKEAMSPSSLSSSLSPLSSADATTTTTLSRRQLKKKKLPRYPRGIHGLERVAVATNNTTAAGNNYDIGIGGSDVGSTEQQIMSCHHWCIGGTVAHLVCRVYRIFPCDDNNDNKNNNNNHDNKSNKGNDDATTKATTTTSIIDDEHHLVLAQVEKATVRADYWDTQKQIFQPQSGDVVSPPPYLTFFGSGMFGDVVCCCAPSSSSNNNNNNNNNA